MGSRHTRRPWASLACGTCIRLSPLGDRNGDGENDIADGAGKGAAREVCSAQALASLSASVWWLFRVSARMSLPALAQDLNLARRRRYDRPAGFGRGAGRAVDACAQPG